MACFLAPAAEAAVTSAVTKALEKRGEGASAQETETKQSVCRKLKWLSNMLWGGSALLAFEHVWHGEVTPWFPFLTAAGDPVELAGMLQELATTGVLMAGLITAVWGGMVLVTNAMEKTGRGAPGAAG